MKFADLDFRAKGWCDQPELNARDIPDDAQLPGLSSFLDVDIMRSLLPSQLCERGSIGSETTKACRGGLQTVEAQRSDTLRECHIVYLRYKPSRSCVIAYRIIDPNASTKDGSGKLVIGRVLARQKQHDHRSGALLSLPDDKSARMRFTCFPDDLQVLSLASGLDRRAVQYQLRALLNDPKLQLLDEDNAWGVVLSYRPERYLLLRLNVGAGNGKQRIVLARWFHQTSLAEQAFKLTESLSRTTDISVSPLALDQIGALCLHEHAPGEPLSQSLFCQQPLEAVGLAANALAQIHQQPCDMVTAALPHRTAEDLLIGYEALAADAMQAGVLDSRLLCRLGNEFRRRLSSRQTPIRLLHGDFSLNQILYNGDQLKVIDFSAVQGQPGIDIGNFLSRLRSCVPASDFDKLRCAFLHCYQSQIDETNTTSNSELAWFEAMSMARDAFIPMKKLRSGWSKTVSEGLELALYTLNAECT